MLNRTKAVSILQHPISLAILFFFLSMSIHLIGIDDIKFRGYAFQIEMKFRSNCRGFTIQEHPIIFTDRTAGTSKMSTKIFREALFGVIELKLKRIFGRI